PFSDTRRRGNTGDVMARQRNTAAVRAQHAANDADQRGLPCPVRSDQADEISRLHEKRDAIDRVYPAKTDCDIVELERRGHARAILEATTLASAARPPGAARMTRTRSPPKTNSR